MLTVTLRRPASLSGLAISARRCPFVVHTRLRITANNQPSAIRVQARVSTLTSQHIPAVIETESQLLNAFSVPKCDEGSLAFRLRCAMLVMLRRNGVVSRGIRATYENETSAKVAFAVPPL